MLDCKVLTHLSNDLAAVALLHGMTVFFVVTLDPGRQSSSVSMRGVSLHFRVLQEPTQARLLAVARA